MVRRSYEMSIPVDVAERGMAELVAGVRITLDCSVRLWRAKRISASELESLLQSVAWQSPTLKRYFDERDKMKTDADTEGFDMLSDEDMIALMNAECEEQGPGKKARTTEHTCALPATVELRPAEPAFLEVLSNDDMLGTTSRPGDVTFKMECGIAGLAITSSNRGKVLHVSSIKKVLSSNKLDHLTLAADKLSADIQEAFAPLVPNKCVDECELRTLKHSQERQHPILAIAMHDKRVESAVAGGSI